MALLAPRPGGGGRADVRPRPRFLGSPIDVYSAPQRTFYGDGNGIDLPWTIT